jgi:plasmid stabilization system protein ParE
MTAKKIIILPFAEVDIKETILFYKEKQKDELAAFFLKSLDETLRLVVKNPIAFPIVKFDLRKTIINKFPYWIYYVFSEGTIYVLAVFHEKRNPKVWQKRRIIKH